MTKKTSSSMQIGRTITEQREKIQSESERLAARKRASNKKTVSVAIVAVILVILAVLIYIGITEYLVRPEVRTEEKVEYTPTVEITDESGVGVTRRMREYVGLIEQDLRDLGYTINRAVVPLGKTREIDIHIDDVPGYVKLNLDRGAAESAEDADRMIRYLRDRNISQEYIDVRVPGKGYYKG